MKKHLPLTIHKDSPFKEKVENHIQIVDSSEQGIILNEEITVTKRRQILRTPWVRLYQDKEVLADLSPWGWYILGYISLNVTWGQERMKISRIAMGMTKPMYRRTILELLTKQIIASTGVREWYWLNVGLVIMGSINKHE